MEFHEVEDIFAALFAEVNLEFPDCNSDQLQEFFDVGEYGLALETLVSSIDSNEISITPKASLLIERLKVLMGM